MLSDPSRWIFNRMADHYDARPPYPEALIDAITQSAPGKRALDLGAGIGYLATPLAARGFHISAVEPAAEMLARIPHHHAIEPIHAQAEALGIDGPFDLVLLADALHFVDAERTGHEIARVRAGACVLAIVRVALDDTPYMRALRAVMEESAPRRVRKTHGNAAQIAALARLQHFEARHFEDHHALSHEALMRLLATISFIGPAMNEERRATFATRVEALGPATWSRTFALDLYR